MALTDEQLEIISDALLPLFQYLEHEAIVDVANRIRESMAYTRSAELKVESMQRMGYSPDRIRAEALKILNADKDFQKTVAENTMEHKKTVKELLQSILKSAQSQKNKVLVDAADMSYFDDLGIWEQGGKKLTDKSFLPQLVDAIRQQASKELKNLTGTTGFKTMSGFEAMENLYRRELDKAMIKVCTGTFSKEQVVYDTVHSLAESGLRTIDFSSGWSMQLDTAVKLAMRTGAHQLAGKITDKNIEQTGENLVRVSTHWGARNTGTGHANHEQWQGRVYFIREGQDYSQEAKRIGQECITSLWYATGYSVDGSSDNDPLGLYGYNCRHRHYPWFEGIYVFPKEDPQPRPVTINGREYDYYAITQKQRSMERSIRALKREREALKSLNMDTKDISTKIKRKIDEYKSFCDVAKVDPKMNRLRYECGTSDLKKSKAWKVYEQAGQDVQKQNEESTWVPQKTSAMKRDPANFRKTTESVSTMDVLDDDMPKFQKATSIEQAIATGKSMTQNGQFVVEGIHLNTVNSFNEAMFNVEQRFGRKLNIAGVKSVKAADAKYHQGSYNPRTGMVSLKGGNSANAMATYQANAEKFFKSGWNASGEVYGTFYHEIGHSVWDDLPIEAKDEIRNLYKETKHAAYEKWMALGGSNSGYSQAEVFGKELSRYALENEQEFFSETFSQIMSGRMKPVSRKVNVMLNKHYKVDNSIEKITESSKILLQEEVVEKAKVFGQELLDNPQLLKYDNGYCISNYVNEKLGYNRKPRVLSAIEFDKISKDKQVLYRGVNGTSNLSAKEMVEQFKDGKFYCGRGIYGNGTYTDTDKTVADYYASGSKDGKVMEMVLADNAKTISFTDIYTEYEKTGIPMIIGDAPEAYQDVIRDVGTYASIKGYDAITLDGFQGKNHVVILNRGKVIVKE
ncbi:MAG: hypothetical protein IJ335_05175 [Lachnospiraceae bacterium]|nr:hypothetical protein [Lachnospiraceae bacterium]